MCLRITLCPRLHCARRLHVPAIAFCPKIFKCQKIALSHAPDIALCPNFANIQIALCRRLHVSKIALFLRIPCAQIHLKELLLFQKYIKIDTLSLLITYIPKASSSKAYLSWRTDIIPWTKDLISIYHDPKISYSKGIIFMT